MREASFARGRLFLSFGMWLIIGMALWWWRATTKSTTTAADLRRSGSDNNNRNTDDDHRYNSPTGEDPFQYCYDHKHDSDNVAMTMAMNDDDNDDDMILLSHLQPRWVELCAPPSVKRRWCQQVYLTEGNSITAELCLGDNIQYALDLDLEEYGSIEGYALPVQEWLDVCVPILQDEEYLLFDDDDDDNNANRWWKTHSVNDITAAFCYANVPRIDNILGDMGYRICDPILHKAQQPKFRVWLKQHSDLDEAVIAFCCSYEYTKQYEQIGYDDGFPHDPDWKEACQYWMIRANEAIDCERVFINPGKRT